MKFLSFCLAVAVLSQAAECKHWALLIAGSNGWYNYRHQADVCHSYQILHSHGIPDENIVVMMYDDIGHNQRNPTPGKIINQPGGGDVYHGVLKDYTGADVTPENFLNILKGDKEAMQGIGSGKVIDSGPDDNVFVYFADHGAPNIIAFPSSELHAKDLNKTIAYMSENKKYKEMVIYIEACESGSMFQNKLPDDIQVFATTAANGAESSYACYYDEKRGTYLGDVYSVKWLEDSDNANFKSETLEDQFKMVREETNTSHVLQFGDLAMGSLTLGLFQGEGKGNSKKVMKTPRARITDAVPSHEVPVHILRNRIRDAPTELERMSIQDELAKLEQSHMEVRQTVRSIVSNLVEESKQAKIINTPATPFKETCYKHAVTHFRKHCFDFNKYEHALRHIYVLANLCDEGLETQRILYVIEQTCRKERIHF